MNLQLARRAQELFKQALDGPVDGRAALLAESCGDDPDLRAEVESLLAAASQAGTFLETPAIGAALPPHDGHDVAQGMIGRRIGAFTIRSIIGSGGMGTVFLAEQDNPRRPVALKVLRTGLLSRAALRRFEYESQILARLQHPNIAQVFEAGTFDHGPATAGFASPYFAMEYIADAQPITSYAENHSLGEHERLALFLTACQAVHFGHQKGIIHRDLKPANILVSGTGLAKIIDFGVARAADPDLPLTATFADAGQLVGTLPYMSPEQFLAGAGGHSDDPNATDASSIDTRTDVYSLGVVLYELLCGQPPYDVGKSSFYEAAHIINQRPPLRPRHVRPAIPRDLETIILKALEKQRERRYQSTADLARDLQRYLNHEPIEARPPTLLYQARLFTRRNRALVGGAAIAVAALIAGLVTSIAFAVEALRQASIAQAVNDFINEDLLRAADPLQSPDRDLTVRAALDNAAANLGERFSKEAPVEASIRDTIGTAYLNLGHYDFAETHLTKALALRRAALGENHADTLTSIHQVAWLRYHQLRYDDAEPLLVDALRQRQAVLGPDHKDTLKSMSLLASLRHRQQRFDEAEALHKQTLEARRRTLGDNHQLVFESIDGLARLYATQGRYADALPLYEQVHQAALREFGPEHRFTLYAMGNLARLYPKVGRRDEGERLLTQSLEQARRILGDDHQDTLVYMTDLGALNSTMGRHAQAEELLEEALDRSKRVHGEAHLNTIGCASHFASLRHNQRRYSDAENIFRQYIDQANVSLGEDHPMTLGLRHGLALALDAQGRREQAIEIYEPLVEKRRRLLGESHSDTLNSSNNLAFVYGNVGRHADAEKIFRQVLDARRSTLGEDHHDVALSLTNLGYIVNVQGRTDEAQEILEQAVATWKRSSSPRHPFASNASAHLAGILLRKGQAADAEPLLREALDIQQNTAPPSSIASIIGQLGDSLASQERYDEAEPLFLDSYERFKNGPAPQRQRAIERLIKMYENSDRPEEAEKWRAVLDDSPAN